MNEYRGWPKQTRYGRVPGAVSVTSVAGSQRKNAKSETTMGIFIRADWCLRGLWQQPKGAGNAQSQGGPTWEAPLTLWDLWQGIHFEGGDTKSHESQTLVSFRYLYVVTILSLGPDMPLIPCKPFPNCVV